MMVSNLMKNNVGTFHPPKKKNPLRNVSEWVGSGDSRTTFNPKSATLFKSNFS